ncbi:MAG: phenylalanine--tRNA ligase subunit beta [Rhodothermaceae bacterium]
MKVSLNWLKTYIDLNGVSVEEIEEKLTTSGLEVEEIIDEAGKFDKFVVGYVKEKGKHPNADKLALCVVSDGEIDHKVVCGAPNVDAGQKIVFAKVGAIVPNGEFQIKKAKIRGEESFGMICSEQELELSDNHDGIMVLDENLKEGTPIADVFGKNDVIFDIAITPNRTDALSHIGVARDLAALFDKELVVPEIKLEEISEKSSDLASVELKNPELCPRYIGKVVKNITIKESPEWLKQRLQAIDLRPINNVVDITNYVMHETGQPLHAFDLDKLAGQKIVVKTAADGEKFTTLDSKERELKTTDLMICDGEKSVAVAGVMGGENSEVSDETTNILIESAYFNPSTVRKTSKKMALQTDASYRFERGCDVEMTLYAAKRCAMLIAELAGGEVAQGEIDEYPEKIEHKKVKLRFSRVKKVLGYEIANSEMKKILLKLGFEILEETEETILVDVPAIRHDVEREIDVIEEIARIYGFDNIPAVSRVNTTLDKKVDESAFVNDTREILSGLGFYEIITNSLLSEKVAQQFGNSVNVMNPQTQEMSHLRPSLLPGALFTIAKNLKVKENNLKLFEVGHTFNRINEKIDSFEDFTETENLLIVLSGKAAEKSWYAKEEKYDFYYLKGYVNEYLSKKCLDNVLTDSYNQEGDLLFDYTFTKSFKKQRVGFGGKLKKEVLKQFEITEDVFVFDFNLTLLKGIRAKAKRFDELLKYPKMLRDFGVVVDKTVKSSEIEKFIRNNSSKLLKDVKLFDIFESDNLGKDKKSLAYQLEYFDYNKTLTDEEVDKDFWNIIEKVKSKFNAELRG